MSYGNVPNITKKFILLHYMTSIFFYHFLKNEQLIKKLDIPYTMENGVALVENYDKHTGQIILGNRMQIEGKFVTFHCNLENILEKINFIAPIVSLQKTKYEVTNIPVNVNHVVKNAYIII